MQQNYNALSRIPMVKLFFKAFVTADKFISLKTLFLNFATSLYRTAINIKRKINYKRKKKNCQL